MTEEERSKLDPNSLLYKITDPNFSDHWDDGHGNMTHIPPEYQLPSRNWWDILGFIQDVKYDLKFKNFWNRYKKESQRRLKK